MLERLTNRFISQRSFFQPPEGHDTGRPSVVVAWHPQLRTIGADILAQGGNAFDAFVAVAAAQNVLAEGASSLAGPLGVLVHDRRQGVVSYLDADFNDPLDRDWRPSARATDGRILLVPGAPAGLEALAARHGTRPFSELLAPAVRLADEGFPVSRAMALTISWRAKILKRSEYGRATFFTPSGKPLGPGDTLRLPEVAAFLTELASQGSSYVYAGAWGEQFLEVVRSSKGVLTGADLAAYRPHWVAPWSTTYRGHALHSSSGHGYGGVWTLLALKTLEHTTLASGGHYADDTDSLGTLVRVARQVWAEPWLIDHRALDDTDLVASRLTAAYTREIWERVAQRRPLRGIGAGGSHSYHIIVVDEDGNAASGTTTLQGDPWGTGRFVQGIALCPGASVPWNTAPGLRRLSPFSIHFAFVDDRLRFAVGGIGNSLVEASFQFLVDLIDHQLPVDEAVSRPRFGTFPSTRGSGTGKNWLDPRVSDDAVKALRDQGLRFERRGVIDTGWGGLVAADSAGLSGVVAPLPYLADPFGTSS